MAGKRIVGNWKMHGSAAMARALVAELGQAEAVLCPPAVLIPTVVEAARGTRLAVGGQDCHAEVQGAHTGDISAELLKDVGCCYVILGHSERRQDHRETSAQVAAKAQSALNAGLVPIICVGETLEQRQAGQAEAVVTQQIQQSLPVKGELILAYEPVWAIGRGLTPTPEDIRRMHEVIHGLLPAGTEVLYGGSVKAANAAEILAIPGVDGALVGGASLKAQEFLAIIAAA